MSLSYRDDTMQNCVPSLTVPHVVRVESKHLERTSFDHFEQGTLQGKGQTH